MDQKCVVGVGAQVAGIVGFQIRLPEFRRIFQQNVPGNQHACGLAANITAANQTAANGEQILQSQVAPGQFQNLGVAADHHLQNLLLQIRHAGLVLFKNGPADFLEQSVPVIQQWLAMQVPGFQRGLQAGGIAAVGNRPELASLFPMGQEHGR